MFTFKVYVKKDGEYAEIDGTPLFPFRWGELLDERLDEAYVDIVDSKTEYFKPTTSVKISVTENTGTTDFFFIVARDDAVKYPVWSDPATYKHSLYLIERTKLLEGIVCPSLTFTDSNAANIAVVVDRLLKCAEPLGSGQAPRYKLCEEDKKRYEKIKAPEFSMTQCTLREQLKIVGGYVHAEPWLDDDNEIHFKDLGDSTVSGLEGKPYVYDGETYDIDSYCTELISNVQNLVSSRDKEIEKTKNGTIIDPPGEIYRSIRASTYTRITDTTGEIETLYPIYELISVKCGLGYPGIYRQSKGLRSEMIDITDYVKEKSLYDTLNLMQNTNDFDNDTQVSTLYYTQGERNIKGLFNTTTLTSVGSFIAGGEKYAISIIFDYVYGKIGKELDGTIQEYLIGEKYYDDEVKGKYYYGVKDLFFQVEYVPITSQMISHGKQKYTAGEERFCTLYNQSENALDARSFGENIKGAAARLGNAERERTYILNSLLELPETGQMIDGYVISAASAEIMPFYIKCTVSLSKDFNRISEYVGVSSVKRMYEISEKKVYKREIFIHNTLVIGKIPDGYSIPKATFLRNLDTFGSLFEGSGKSYSRCELAQVRGSTEASSSVTPIPTILLPVMIQTMGNTGSFSFGFKDNYSAGDGIARVYIDGRWTTWSSAAPYTDYSGEITYLEICLNPASEYHDYDSSAGKLTEGDLEGISALTIGDFLPYVAKSVWDENNEARIEYADNYPFKAVASEIRYNHLLLKDNRESPFYTFELEAKTTEDNLNIHPAFMTSCPMFSGVSLSAKPTLYLSKTPINKFAHQITIDTNYKDIGYIDAEREEYTVQDGENNETEIKYTKNLNLSLSYYKGADNADIIPDFKSDTFAAWVLVTNDGRALLSRNMKIDSKEVLEASINNLSLYVIPE